MANPRQLPTIDALKAQFGLFVSARPGHLVSRYGTASATRSNKTIGGVRRALPSSAGLGLAGAGAIEIDYEAIVALPHRELELFRREYARALRDGALEERTAEEYLATLVKEAELQDAAAKAAAKAAKSSATPDAGGASTAGSDVPGAAAGPGDGKKTTAAVSRR